MRPFSPAWFRQERQAAARRWYLWPYSVALGLYFAGGVVWCLYKGFWAGAAFTAAALVGHIFLFAVPSRRASKARRATGRTAA
jgi:uncharacterized membrane protein